MQLRHTLACILVLAALGLVSALMAGLPPGAGIAVVGALIFFSCLTGMQVARLAERSRHAEQVASHLARANARLETEVHERTRDLSAKIAELEDARADAVSASLAKSRFLASMSHELRTPLNAILGFAELIQNQIYGRVGDERYTEYARLIQVSGKHLLSLIHDVLDLAKIEAGKLELHPEALDVGGIVADAESLIGARSDLSRHDVAVDILPDLPQLLADRRAAIQMIVNLLSNAVKFTPDGGMIAVSAFIRADGGITIQVRDTGIGIAKADIPKALAAFGQVGARAERYRGTGLGLPIVRQLMEAHGGTLELDSEPGQGTTVELVFPFERSLGSVGQDAVAA